MSDDRDQRPLPALVGGRLVEPVVRGVDGFYLAFQGALKSLGLVPETGAVPETTTAGGRYAVLEERPGRWPATRILLPDSAVFWYRVESIFRRAALWRALAPGDEVETHVRDAARAVWPEARESRRSEGVLELAIERSGVRTMVRVVSRDAGFVALSLGQKVRRLQLPGGDGAPAGSLPPGPDPDS